MLERLYIKNVALIEEADISFDCRLNVLSGETGSGKSVILDSINFVLGSKAEKSMIRFGKDEAFVKAEFSVDGQSAAARLLQDMDIEVDDTVIISRKFNTEGKGAIKINGNAVTSAMLKKVAAHLVDVHGQSEHFFLLSENNQLSVIDTLCGVELKRLKDNLLSLINEKKECRDKIASLGGSESERAQKLDLLLYQINEIESAHVKIGETAELKAKKKVFDNAERVVSAIGAALNILGGDGGCVDMLSSARKTISSVADIGEEYASVSERLDNLTIEAEDLKETVCDIADGLSFDDNEARYVEERLELLRGLSKKYGADEQEILLFLQNAKAQYDALNDAETQLTKINKKISELDGKIFEVCSSMTQTRKKTCESFCSAVTEQLKSLNIPNAQFFVQFSDYDRQNISVSTTGADKICFMFSANMGEPPKPLNKVISGGEMSRFMLAVKTQLKGLNGISTYIFDEIDAGISGVTAKTVADKFVDISKETQIIAVSHLPQVCAAATAQYLIYKIDDQSGKTVTRIKRLNSDERVDEIVRLTGSIATDAARVHARELLAQFNN